MVSFSCNSDAFITPLSISEITYSTKYKSNDLLLVRSRNEQARNRRNSTKSLHLLSYTGKAQWRYGRRRRIGLRRGRTPCLVPHVGKGLQPAAATARLLANRRTNFGGTEDSPTQSTREIGRGAVANGPGHLGSDIREGWGTVDYVGASAKALVKHC